MTDKTIKIACEAKTTATLEQLEPLQGKLKTLSETSAAKLEKSIIDRGFSFPFFVWISPKGKRKLVDGHQRLTVLQGLEGKGWTIPPLPVAEIHAASEKEAKELILLASSQYGHMEHDDVLDWISENTLDVLSLVGMVELPGIDLCLPEPIEFDNDGNHNAKLKTDIELIISLTAENEAEKLYNEMKQRGYECRVLI